jgi:hypothetical protein
MRKFKKRANKLFKRFRVDVFHTIDGRRTDKDFEGWSMQLSPSDWFDEIAFPEAKQPMMENAAGGRGQWTGLRRKAMLDEQPVPLRGTT